jgi:hypothetical protein
MRSLLIGWAVMLSIAVSGCGSTRPAYEPNGQPAAVVSGSSLPGASASPPPREFVSVMQGGANPLSWNMSLYSSGTGVLTRRLGSFSEKSWTNNGLAFAPDGSAVYFTLIPQHDPRAFYLWLVRFDVATRHQMFVAKGAQPALSQDGTQLAYAAFPHGLAVRNLATGQTRTLGLAQLGKAAELSNATIGWLGHGSEVAIIPSQTPWDLVGRPPRLSWCGTPQTHPVIVFVHVPAPPAPLSAECVHLPGPALAGATALAASPASPTTLLLATDSYPGPTRVETITQTGAISPVLAIPNSLPVAFDPSGTHLLYLVGHTPPRLWEATIANGRLTDRVRLPKRTHGWGPVAW